MANFEIIKYRVVMTNNGEYGWIMLFNSDSISAATHVARLNFVSYDVGTIQQSGNFITVAMHINSFERTIDMLRNEKPVYFGWFSSWAGVYTGSEPVGEAELEAT